MLWVGPLLARGGFIEGWFDPESGEEGKGTPHGDALKGIILPPFRNCHAHLGDTWDFGNKNPPVERGRW